MRDATWPSFLAAIACTGAAVISIAFFVSACVSRNVLMIIVEAIICYCFIGSAVYYWRKYRVHRKRSE